MLILALGMEVIGFISRSPFNYSKCLNFPNQTDNFKYDSFNFNGKPEVTFSFWYNNYMTVNINDKILGTKDTIYWAFEATQNRSGLGGSVKLTIKTGDNVSSNTAQVTIPNVANADSGWNLFTGTYDGSNFRGYLNGEQVGSDQPITGNLMSSTGSGTRDLNITVRDGAGMAGMKISNFVIWDKGLTSPEVATLFNGGTPFLQKSDFPQQANMSLWNTLTDMNTSSGGGVFDKSGNGVVITNPTNPPVSFNLPVSTLNGTSSGMTEANLIDENVSVVNGESDTLPASALVQSDLTRKLPFSNYSINFDSASADYFDYFSINSSGTLDTFHQNPFSISLWFKTSTGGTMILTEKATSSSDTSRAFYIYLSSGVILWYGATASPSYTDGSYNDGNWHHVACVAESDSVARIYVDGVDDTNNIAKDYL
jgi:hypothetical protein